MILAVTLLSLVAIGAAAQLPSTHTEKFVDDWWEVDAEPEFSAEIMQGDLQAGRPARLNVLLTNVGEVTAFEALDTPTTAVEINESAFELKYEKGNGPTTAKNLVATLEGSGPVEVETSTAMAPTPVIEGGSVNLPFEVSVDQDAESGPHNLTLRLSYRYLEDVAVEYENGQYQPFFYYKTGSRKLDLRAEVRRNAVFEVSEVEVVGGELRPGRDATVRVTYRNEGKDTAYDAEASLVPKAPITPSASLQTGAAEAASGPSTFVGDVAPGEEAKATFDVSIGRDALAKNYSVSSRISYDDEGGNAKQSRPLKVVLSLKPFRHRFEVVDTHLGGELTPGGETSLEITFRNGGNEVARDALTRISLSDTFTSTSDTAYLGDVEPGEAATGRFRISASSDAMPKTYGLDTEIKYRDENGLSKLSDTLKAEVEVSEGGGGLPVPGLTVTAALLGLPLALLIRRC